MYIWETHQLLIIRDGILGNWIWLTICATKSLRWVGVAHISMSECMYIHVVKRTKHGMDLCNNEDQKQH